MIIMYVYQSVHGARWRVSVRVRARRVFQTHHVLFKTYSVLVCGVNEPTIRKQSSSFDNSWVRTNNYSDARRILDKHLLLFCSSDENNTSAKKEISLSTENCR